MKKLVLLITISIIINAGFSACSPSAAAVNTGISIVDGLDKQITLDQPAENIVTLSPPITEMLFAIGAGDQVIARDSFSDYPEAALSLPDIGGGFAEYDLETIVSLAPDLVIAGSINTPELVKSLEDLGFTVYYLANPSDLEGTFASIEALGVLSGHKNEAQELVKGLRSRVDAVSTALEGIEEKPTVYYELDATDLAKPYTPGPNTFYTSMIEMAGGENIGEKLEFEWAQISLEQLLIEDPDLILLGDAMWGVTPESVAERAGWSSLTAVSNGMVLPFDDNLIARIGPRQVDGLEALAKIFHPDLFK
ncbi:MAG: ABC transporter substrate-binding protein [Anaerolineaceae bacterium]|nr:ABC transporter substrate-binding protein [Anaerolineaceae bacterium]